MSRRVVVAIVAIVAIVLIVTTLAIAAYVGLAGAAHERREIADRLVAAVELAGAGGTVEFVEVADFEWSEVHVFAPYESVTSMSERLGFEWSPFGPFDQLLWGEWPLNSEDEFLLAFADRESSRVVGWTFTAFADRAVLFKVDGRSESFSMPREEACLQVIEVSDDPPRKNATVEPARCP